jgi:hypothetical protein
MIRVVHPGSGSGFFYLSRIPDPGVKKAQDPVSGSATLINRSEYSSCLRYQETKQHQSARCVMRFNTAVALDISHQETKQLHSARCIDIWKKHTVLENL